MSTIIEQIQEQLDKFKKAELRVARYLLENGTEVAGLTITELAEKAETSEPTVIRLCRKIGLKGYTDLRLSLAREIPNNDFSPKCITPEDSSVKILHKLFQTNIEALQSNLTVIDSVYFNQAVEDLARASQICFYAFGGSGNIVRDSHHKFFRLGVPCEVHTDAHMQFMSASLLNEKSIVIAVALKGSTKDLVESVKIAKNAGAKVIGLIGSRKSPLGKVCDLTLTVSSEETAASIYPLSTRLLLLVVLDALYLAVSMKKWNSVKDCLEKVKDTLAHRNY